MVPNQLMAEARSVTDKIYSQDFMNSSQEVEIHKGQKTVLYSQTAGAKLHTENKRSIVLIDNQEKLEDLPTPLVERLASSMTTGKLSNHYIFANFLHQQSIKQQSSDYHIAIVPKSVNIKEVFFELIKNKQGLIVSSQVRLVLDQAFKMIPQESETYPILISEDKSIVFATSIVSQEGQSENFDPIQAITGGHSYALQASSNNTRFQYRKETYEVKSLSNTAKSKILKLALEESDKIQEEGIFHLAFNNSFSHSLKILSAGITNLEYRISNPIDAVKRLRLDHSGQIRQTNQEFNMNSLPTNDSETLQKLYSSNFYDTLEKVSQLILTNQAKLIAARESSQNRIPNEKSRDISSLENLKEFLHEKLNRNEIKLFLENLQLIKY